MLRRIMTAGAAVFLASVVWLTCTSFTLAQIEHGGPAPTRTPILPTLPPDATPTPDRLAAPPTVPSPNQADEGAQLYWLHCQPCHGDRGQGLTDEWRAQYPPEEEYCWESGCHGNQPYHQDFALPTAVPAVIGDGVLQKFQTMDAVYRYVSATMPYFFPGELTQEEYLAILAHITRENGWWDGQTLTTSNLLQYRLPAASGAGAAAQPTPVEAVTAVSAPILNDAWWIGLVVLVALMVVGGIFLWRNRVR
jgi:hypothetical protein